MCCVSSSILVFAILDKCHFKALTIDQGHLFSFFCDVLLLKPCYLGNCCLMKCRHLLCCQLIDECKTVRILLSQAIIAIIAEWISIKSRYKISTAIKFFEQTNIQPWIQYFLNFCIGVRIVNVFTLYAVLYWCCLAFCCNFSDWCITAVAFLWKRLIAD